MVHELAELPADALGRHRVHPRRAFQQGRPRRCSARGRCPSRTRRGRPPGPPRRGRSAAAAASARRRARRRRRAARPCRNGSGRRPRTGRGPLRRRPPRPATARRRGSAAGTPGPGRRAPGAAPGSERTMPTARTAPPPAFPPMRGFGSPRPARAAATESAASARRLRSMPVPADGSDSASSSGAAASPARGAACASSAGTAAGTAVSPSASPTAAATSAPRTRTARAAARKGHGRARTSTPLVRHAAIVDRSPEAGAIPGASGRTRTDTSTLLRSSPLPLGYGGRAMPNGASVRRRLHRVPAQLRTVAGKAPFCGFPVGRGNRHPLWLANLTHIRDGAERDWRGPGPAAGGQPATLSRKACRLARVRATFSSRVRDSSRSPPTAACFFPRT